MSTPSWPKPDWRLLGCAVVACGATCLLALEAIVTFPLAVLTAVLAVLALSPPPSFVLGRHWGLLVGLAIIAGLLTWLWQRAWAF